MVLRLKIKTYAESKISLKNMPFHARCKPLPRLTIEERDPAASAALSPSKLPRAPTGAPIEICSAWSVWTSLIQQNDC